MVDRPQTQALTKTPRIRRNFFFEPSSPTAADRTSERPTKHLQCLLVSSLGSPGPRPTAPRAPASAVESMAEFSRLLAPHTCTWTWETRVDLPVIQQGSQWEAGPFGRPFLSTAISTTTPSGVVLRGMRPPGIDRLTGRRVRHGGAVNAATKLWAETRP